MKFRLLPAVVSIAALLGVIPDTVAAQSESRPPACVALTLPSVEGIDGSATSFAAAVRDLFASFLTGPGIKTLQLDSRLPSQAALEAREKECGYVLLATVTRKRSSGSGVGGVFGRAAGMAAVRTPVGGGVAGAIAGSATTAVGQAIYGLASQTRAKDEIALTYRLGAPDAVLNATPVSSKAKAKADGEDLLTGLVEKAATAILATATAERRQ